MAGPLFLGGPTLEGKYPPDFLKWEEDGHYSRDVVTFTAGGAAVTLQAGPFFEGHAATSIVFAGTNPITSILMETVTVPATQARKLTVIKRTAVIDSRYLTAGAQTVATIVANLATNIPSLLVRTGA